MAVFWKGVVSLFSRLWNFATTMFFIFVIIGFIFFVLLVLKPDAVLGAISIISNWLAEVGIVGSG